ncbi:kelch-like protein 24 [Acanthaster planci]|uniref:Kelch-like protein 24 n=1 Tax=Acanthaster planci TaxID=133434 RepID=A0A8B7YKF9_ACAPL|nr:kelch-like protein 24 [Acanthaster planci]XP_022093114.1 kelch-like protein 24 [Acanthaster planci]XP_022093123.1 kelch-like protein 24 [Acanthaster planci]
MSSFDLTQEVSISSARSSYSVETVRGLCGSPNRGSASPSSSGSPGDKESSYVFFDALLPSNILSILNEMRLAGECTDIVLCVGSREFSCHRALLAAASPYFRAMFTGDLRESYETRIALHDVCPKMVGHLIEFAYKSRIIITEENAEELYITSNFLQFEQVARSCAEFLQRNICAGNCLSLARFAETYRCLPLQRDAERFVLEHFEEVSLESEFLDLRFDQLVAYIRHDELAVRSEKVVYDAVSRWIRSNLEERALFRPELLRSIRLPFIEEDILNEILSGGDGGQLPKSRHCVEVLKEAKCCQWLMKRGYRVLGPGTSPRSPGRRSEIIVLVGGHQKTSDGEYIYSDEVYCMDAHDAAKSSYPTWYPLARMPHHMKRKYSVAALGSDIYVTGGYDTVCEQSSRLVWRYSFSRNRWKPTTSLLDARHSHGSASLNGRLYVVGGKTSFQNTRLDSVECYNPFTDEWKQVAPLPIAVSVPSVVGHHGRLYVVGGATQDECACSHIQCYDPITDVWSLLPNLEFSRKTLRVATAQDGRMFVLGGRKPREVSEISLETSEECPHEPSNEQRTFPGVTIAGDRLWVFGGKIGEESRSCAEYYDLQTNTWTTLVGFMPKTLYMHGCVTITDDT